MSDIILELQDLKTYFPVKGSRTQFVKAVDGVSFQVKKGETVGLVGESGCGKSTIGRTIMRFNQPTSGKIIFDGDDITTADMKPYRQRMQMVFQDPYSSLDPRMSVGDIVGEPLDIHNPKMNRRERYERILEQMKLVGLNSEQLNRFPHEFSGGQRQRISIARAMVIKPEFMVLDEPVSALDVSIQAQIINLLNELRDQLGLTIMFIAHDLSVVKYFSDRIGVMYYGKMVELASSDELFARPMHPYTRSLLSAIPLPDPHAEKKRTRITYNPLDAHDYSVDKPSLREIAPGHFVNCNDEEERRYRREFNL